MPRRKTAKRCCILPWLSARPDCSEGRFIQVGNSLFLSKEFQALKPGPQMLFLAMALESGGKRDFEFPLSSATKYGIDDATFWRYVQKLEDAGFIVRHSMANLRKPNEYNFTLAWKGITGAK